MKNFYEEIFDKMNNILKATDYVALEKITKSLISAKAIKAYFTLLNNFSRSLSVPTILVPIIFEFSDLDFAFLRSTRYKI